MDKTSFQTEIGLDEICPGCDGETLLVSADDGTLSVECQCSSATVLAA